MNFLLQQVHFAPADDVALTLSSIAAGQHVVVAFEVLAFVSTHSAIAFVLAKVSDAERASNLTGIAVVVVHCDFHFCVAFLERKVVIVLLHLLDLDVWFVNIIF